MNKDADVEALRRLIRIAEGDTGQSGRVANFLLAWWNAPKLGGFDLVDLWMLDSAIVSDMIKVFGLIASCHSYPDQLGLEADFHRMITEWRHSEKHRTTIRHVVELFEGSGLSCRLSSAANSQGMILHVENRTRLPVETVLSIAVDEDGTIRTGMPHLEKKGIEYFDRINQRHGETTQKMPTET